MLTDTEIDTRGMTDDELALEPIRLLILGGLFVCHDFERDDMPVADRIAVAQHAA
jgi:hypothetical protein